MSWDELLEHMDNLSSWGRSSIKSWEAQAAKAAMIQKPKVMAAVSVKAVMNLDAKACAAASLKQRAAFQNKVAGACIDMCKEVGAFPKCTGCPNYVAQEPDDGVMSWDELLEHMDNLSSWGRSSIKSWEAQAAKAAMIQKPKIAFVGTDAKACAAAELKRRAQVQNKIAGACIDMCKE